MCSWKSAAEFDSSQAAREFFNSWAHRDKYKMAILESKRWVDVPDPVYPDGHPRQILEAILKNERTPIAMEALTWFSGNPPLRFYKLQRTKNRYRDILLKYGIDLFKQPSEEMRTFFRESNPKKLSNFEFEKGAVLRVVK